jgi:putative ABC transport system permease protein
MGALAPIIRAAVPQVLHTARVEQGSAVLAAGKNLFSESRLYWVDPAFLVMFSYPLVQGNPKTALARPLHDGAFESAARKYFGEANPWVKPCG